MNVTILYDSEPRAEGLVGGWGFSAVVGGTILFDTGESGEALLQNMRRLGFAVERISAVVLSHDHWDHTGGLWDFLEARAGSTALPVYICPGFSEETRKRIGRMRATAVDCAESTEVAPGVQTTGEVTGEHGGSQIAEQGLVLTSPHGLSLLTGCAHPDIGRMVGIARKLHPEKPFAFAGGGFHLMKSSGDRIDATIEAFRRAGVERAAPTHCSGDECIAAFRRAYADRFVELGVGATLDL